MRLREALLLPSFRGTRVVAGEGGLDHEVRWAHVVDIPNPGAWVRAGDLLLTAGYGWPLEPTDQRAQIRSLAEKGLAGLCLAVPQYLDHFSRGAREEADRCDLTLLEIPWETPFVTVTEELHRAILTEQYHIIERSELIHRELTRVATEGATLQDLARALGRLLDRSVTFEDTDGRLLAFYTVHDQDDSVRRLTLEQARTPEEVTHALQSRGILAAIRASGAPVHVPPIPEVGLRPRLVCPIRLNGELIGSVWIIEGETPLNDLDARAAEHAAVVAALRIAHQRELRALELRLGSDCISSLIEGSGEVAPDVLERASLLGFAPESAYRAGVFVLNEPVPVSRDGLMRRERVAARLRARLQRLGESPLLAVTLNHVVALLPETCAVEPLVEHLRGEGVAVLLGRVHRGIEGVRLSYREALSLAAYGKPGEIARYDELIFPRVLQGDPEAQRAFVDRYLGSLRAQRNGDVLVETVGAFVAAGFNLREAASALAIHPNTLRYRLRCAADSLQISFDDPQTRFYLQLAYHLDEGTPNP